MKRRASITMRLEVDLDMFPGFGFTGRSFFDVVENNLQLSVPHYKPELTLLDLQEKPYTWVEGQGSIRPTFKDPTPANNPAEELRAKFDQDDGSWGEHPDYLWESWVSAVAHGDTRRGYWDWVAAKLEEEGDKL